MRSGVRPVCWRSTMESEFLHTRNSHESKSEANKEIIENNSIIYKLLSGCKSEMEKNCLHKPLENYVERVSYYTGMSKEEIYQIESKCMSQIDYDYKHFELNERFEILKCVTDMYVMKQNVTHKDIYAMCNNLNNYMNFDQFQYMIDLLGFEYRKDVSGKYILVEDPDLTFERYNYLNQIAKYRSKSAPIYFIDEVFVDKTYNFPKPWIKNIDISSEACDGYVFFHAVSNKGCLNGFFCAPTSKMDFVKWITHILIPHLHIPSIIVMDKNDLHRSRANVITKYDSKEEMLKYLRKNNIPCSEKLHKAELYSLITKCLVKDGSYIIDDVLKSHGHKVLWLPSKFHDLSMTNFLWKYILESKAMFLHNKELRDIKITLFEGLMKLDNIFWEQFEEDLCKLEEKILDIDIKASEALEKNYTFNENILDKPII